MPERREISVEFDLEAMRHAAEAAEHLSARLPQHALKLLAEEVVHRLAERGTHVVDAAHPPDREIERLCEALLSADDSAASRLIEAAQRAGAPVDAVYTAYLAAGARRLGDYWTDNRASFLEVTMAIGRIYAILRGLRHAIDPVPGSPGRAALFATVPGDEHTLGVSMAADLFRQHGWDITLRLNMLHAPLLAEISTSDCRIIGLSANRVASLLPLGRLIVAIRIARPSAFVLVGGTIALTEPESLALMGADAVASDHEEALAAMDRWVGEIRA